jgi:hypothetical protein
VWPAIRPIPTLHFVLVPREDRLDKAEFAQAAGQGIEFGVADLPRVGGVGAQVVDGDLDDVQVSRGNGWHWPFSAGGQEKRALTLPR